MWAWGDNRCGELGKSGGNSSTPVKVEHLADVRAIAAGGGFDVGHSVAVTNDGTVYAWGENFSGELGNGTSDPNGFVGDCPRHDVPSVVTLPPGTKAVGVASGGPGDPVNGGGHSLAVADDGKVYAWGDNAYGQLGSPNSAQSPVPVLVAGLTGKKVTSVAAGQQHSLAVIDDGTAYAWGDNQFGELGTGAATAASPVPTLVSGLSGVRQVDGGVAHSLAVTNDGKVYAWGAVEPAAGASRYVGQTGPTASATPVEVTGFGGPVSAIAAGPNHSLAVGGAAIPAKPANVTRPSFTGEATEGQTLTGDHGTWSGSDLTFSYQWQRCPADGSSACQDIVGATELDYTLVTADVGTKVKLVVTATNAGGSATAESDLSAQVAAAPPPPAGGHVVVGFGRNNTGQIGDGTTTNRTAPTGVVGLDNVTALEAGIGSSLALRSDGSAWAWGSNGSGQLGDGTKSDRSVPVRVKLTGSYTAVAAGATHGLALRSDHSVWGWGTNDCGQLGATSGATVVPTPVKVKGLENLKITAIAAGGGFSVAVTDQGKVYSWGNTGSGGTGSCRNEVPAEVSFPGGTRPVVAVAAGASHSLAVTDDGKVYSWGANTSGQLGRPNSGPSANAQQVTGLGPAVIAGVAAGDNHSLARTRDGIVYAWGDNTYGQLGTGTGAGAAPQSFQPTQVAGVDGVKELAGGGYHSLARRSDGTVWAWGALKGSVTGADPYYGQTGSASSATPAQVKQADGTPLAKAVALAAGDYHSLAAVTGDTPPPPPPLDRPPFGGHCSC